MTEQIHVDRAPAVPVTRRVKVMLVIVALLGLAAFCWPLLVAPASPLAGVQQAPLIFAALLPLVLALVVAEMSGGLETKALAMLGVLSAVGAAVRPLGAGTAGIETVFVLLILAGRVFGPGFGFALGVTTMFASALITAGVGPWLPFQMIAAGYVGLGAGLLPRCRPRAEIVLLAGYGVGSALAFGTLMNLSFWPFLLGVDTVISYDAHASLGENLRAFALYALATSLGWDIGRAITNAVLVVLVGPALLVVLRRAARRTFFTEA